MTGPTLTLDRATEFFAEVFLGKHHIPSEVRSCGRGGWKVNAVVGDRGLSTYDADALTRLVFLAHDWCVRLSIRQGGPRAVAIVIHQRHFRTGSINDLHPTLDQALASWRMFHPAPPGTPFPTEVAFSGVTTQAQAARVAQHTHEHAARIAQSISAPPRAHWSKVLGVRMDASTSEARAAYDDRKREASARLSGLEPELAAELQALREAYDACCREHQVEDTNA